MAKEAFNTGGNGESNGEESQRAASNFDKWKAEAREHYKAMDLKALAQAQADGRDRKEEAEQELSKINAFYDVLRYEMVPGKMDEQGIDTITLDGIGRISLTADLLVSTKPGMKEALFGWLKKHKLSDLIQPGVNSSTLKAFVKGRIKEAKPVPNEFLNITPITRASITKVKD